MLTGYGAMIGRDRHAECLEANLTLNEICGERDKLCLVSLAFDRTASALHKCDLIR